MPSGNQHQRGRGNGWHQSPEGDGPDNAVRFDFEHCLELLAGQTFGRLSFSARALPAIIPVRSWLDDRRIYLQLGRDEWLPHLQGSQVVQLQIDQISPESMTGWQVTATGMAAPLLGAGRGADRPRPAQLGMDPQLVTGHPIQFD